MKNTRRIERVASLIRQTLSEILLQSVDDPRVRDVVITHVKVTADLGIAKIYVRAIGECPNKDQLLSGLRACKGYVRSLLSKKLNLLRIPKLEFLIDEEPDEIQRISALFENLK